jgi:hypothetical protein
MECDEMQWHIYLNEKFPGLELRMPLFYNWPFGIRFELGDPEEENLSAYMDRVYFRAISLFKALHAGGDDLLLVANVHHHDQQNVLKRRKLGIFSKYVKSRKVLHKLRHQVIPYVYADDEEDLAGLETHRYELPCKVSDLETARLLKAICNRDVGLKPVVFYDMFFINLVSDTIFQIYDDRGCDVIASSRETLRSLYEKYNPWILDYDRADIDRLFQP